jgi:hypothetical protein
LSTAASISRRLVPGSLLPVVGASGGQSRTGGQEQISTLHRESSFFVEGDLRRTSPLHHHLDDVFLPWEITIAMPRSTGQ